MDQILTCENPFFLSVPQSRQTAAQRLTAWHGRQNKKIFKKDKKRRKKQKKKKKKKKIEQQTRYSLFEYGNDCFTLIHAHDERTAIRVFSDQW